MGTTDKMQDKVQSMGGEAKQKLGEATDNKEWQREGKSDQVKGDLKQAGEKVKDAFS
jgi:uncharacterized protein YjbJ (UPF0337 family)